MIQQYWGLEVELCQIAGRHKLTKAGLLANRTLTDEVRSRVEIILWEQVHCLKRIERCRLRLVKEVII